MPERRNWKRVALEVVVIVSSILLAFGIEAWWSELQDREDERESLERLLRDIDQDLTDFLPNLERAEVGIAAAEWLLAARDAPSASTDSVEHYLGLYLSACSGAAFNSSEYESLRASGGLNRIRDADFRQRLTVHYEQYPQLVRMHERDCETQFAVLQHVADEVRVDMSGFTYFVTVVGSVDQLLENRRFQAAIAGHLLDRKIIRYWASRGIERLERLRADGRSLTGRSDPD